MIRVAIPSKGRLMDRTLALLEGAGYRVGDRRRDLFQVDPRNEVEFVFLRPVDIPVYVAGGELDAGVTGEDLVRERGVGLEPRLRLGFGDSRLCLAVADASPITELTDVAGLRVATSFPRLAAELLPGPPPIVELAGSVEASVRLGVADAILDLVETGSTLRAAGLRILGEPLLRSEACLFVGPHVGAAPEYGEQVSTFCRRLEARLLGETYVMLEYDVPRRAALRRRARSTPGIESPTVARLEREDWFSVRSMVRRAEAHALMSELATLGAKAIVLTRVENALEIKDTEQLERRRSRLLAVPGRSPSALHAVDHEGFELTGLARVHDALGQLGDQPMVHSTLVAAHSACVGVSPSDFIVSRKAHGAAVVLLGAGQRAQRVARRAGPPGRGRVPRRRRRRRCGVHLVGRGGARAEDRGPRLRPRAGTGTTPHRRPSAAGTGRHGSWPQPAGLTLPGPPG